MTLPALLLLLPLACGEVDDPADADDSGPGASDCTATFLDGSACACTITLDASAWAGRQVDALVLDLAPAAAAEAVCGDTLTQAQALDLVDVGTGGATLDLAGHAGRTLVVQARHTEGMPDLRAAFAIEDGGDADLVVD